MHTAIESDKLSRRIINFISLKWKVLILSSLLLIGITATISGFNYINLQSLYKAQRENVFQQNKLQIEGLLARSARNLQSMASLITNMDGVQSALQTGDMHALDEAISKHWVSVQMDSGIDSLRFYDLSNKPVYSRNVNDSAMGDATFWVSHVNASEQPLTVISCLDVCLQMSAIPILLQGRHTGVLLLARSVADIVLDFKNIAGSDVGVMIKSAGDSVESQRYIKEWGSRIIALTNWPESADTIHFAAASNMLPGQGSESINFKYKGGDYEIKSFRLGDDASDASFIIIDDVTTEIAIINKDNARNVMASLTGLIVAEILLLALLWRPMSRLRVTALALPLLSERNYETAKNAVQMSRSFLHVNDESDVLVDTTLDLSNQLEKYHTESQAHLRALAQRADEIEGQKDFVTNLIKTANAVIITQDDRGEILSINDYGRELIGYPLNDLIGSSFARVISPEALTADVYRDISDLNAGRRVSLSQELQVTGKDQSIRIISWHHSRVPGTGEGDTTIILTVGHDITERINAERNLSWLAEHDSLTGMYNRRRFQNHLDSTISEAVHNSSHGALLFMDLDQFKDVNDSSGHQAGDILLKEVAACLSEVVPEEDLVARIGGDEFAIVLKGGGEAAAITLAKSVQARLAQVSLPVKGRIFCVTSSIGIAMFPEHGDNFNDVFACADLAMYQAKAHGRGCWHVYSRTEKIRERLNERLYWKGVLEKALEIDQFELYFQPIVDIASGRARHFEALLRYIDDDGIITAPGHFIEIAESCGLIHAIDRMVITKAIKQLAWLQGQGKDVCFSVNLSAHAFSDPGLFELLKGLLDESGLEPSRLILEVTETAAIADFTVAHAYITSIKALGCRFALDDFGVGFSSFYSLKKLPVDYVKIDGSFIRGLHTNPDDQVLVKSLSQAAQGFGKKTIAEFVENRQTLDILRQYNVDYAQGFLLGKPMPAEEAFQLTSVSAIPAMGYIEL